MISIRLTTYSVSRLCLAFNVKMLAVDLFLCKEMTRVRGMRQAKIEYKMSGCRFFSSHSPCLVGHLHNHCLVCLFVVVVRSNWWICDGFSFCLFVWFCIVGRSKLKMYMTGMKASRGRYTGNKRYLHAPGRVGKNNESSVQLRAQRDVLQENKTDIQSERLQLYHQVCILRRDEDELQAKNFCNGAGKRLLEMKVRSGEFELLANRTALQAGRGRVASLEDEIALMRLKMADVEEEYEANVQRIEQTVASIEAVSQKAEFGVAAFLKGSGMAL